MRTRVDEVSGDRQAEGSAPGPPRESLQALQRLDSRRLAISSGGAGPLLEELGLGVRAARTSLEAWRVEMAANAPLEAEGELRRAHETFVEIGEKYMLCTVAGLLGQTLYALGRFDDVDAFATQAQELAPPADVDSQALWRCLRGKLLAHEGSFAQAESLVKEAIDILDPTDAVLFQHGAYLDLAEVARLATDHDTLQSALSAALALAETKDSITMRRQVEALRNADAIGTAVS